MSRRRINSRRLTDQGGGKPSCKVCNNLDPRGHPTTFYDAEGASKSIASLTLAVNTTDLARSKGRCLQCKVLCDALDLRFPAWHKNHARVCVEILEKESVKIELRDEASSNLKLELYVAQGMNVRC